MWRVANQTPYAAERNWIRDKNGAHVWLIAVRATYDIAPSGALKLADEQPPPPLAPEYFGEPGASSLKLDSDLLALKPGTDVVLDAHAHAPGGRPAASVPVSARVADLAKDLIVHGTRVYYRGALGLTTSAPRPFTSQPIRYEFAFGGADTTAADPRRHKIDLRNPIGKGVTADVKRLEHQPAHTVEYLSGDPARRGPAGFGPVDRAWEPRLALAGTYDARWEQTRSPLLPDDYDERFAMSSPEDQRTARALRGGETVALVNLTPEGTLRFTLPKVFLAFRTRFPGGSREHRAKLATVFIATEERKLSLIWQSSLPVPAGAVDYLDRTIVREKRYIS